MLFLGCDPDMHTLAMATVREDMTIQTVKVFICPLELTESFAVVHMIRYLSHGNWPFTESTAAAVESQEIYQDGPSKTKNPRSILHLARVAGAALALISMMDQPKAVYFPAPVQWKGSRDKLAHHKHILARAKVPAQAIGQMGGKEPYCTITTTGPNGYPIVGAENINHSDWKHVIDAIGLAQYAAERYLHETAKAKALAAARAPV